MPGLPSLDGAASRSARSLLGLSALPGLPGDAAVVNHDEIHDLIVGFILGAVFIAIVVLFALGLHGNVR